MAICASGDPFLWSEETRETTTPTLTLRQFRGLWRIQRGRQNPRMIEYQQHCKHDKVFQDNIHDALTSNQRPASNHDRETRRSVFPASPSSISPAAVSIFEPMCAKHERGRAFTSHVTLSECRVYADQASAHWHSGDRASYTSRSVT